MGASAGYSASASKVNVASPPAAYGVHSMGSNIYHASAPTGYAASPSTYGPMGSYIAHSTISDHVKYPQASGNASIHYPSGTISSSHSLSAVLSDWHPQVSVNSTIPHPTGLISSSHSLSATSTNSTTPIVTPTPTPEPSCETAPIALRSGYSCDTLSAACDCLGLSSATEDMTSTTTFTEVVYTTEATLITVITELTGTLSITVPAATLTLTPSSTVTEDVLVTANPCPCSGSTSSICGTTPDTCRDLQTDTSNCGTCGNICASGESCSAGKCIAPALPDVPSCAASSCMSYVFCGAGGSCICVATSEGSGVCILGSTRCSKQKCITSSDCDADEKFAINSCRGKGVCIKAMNNCPNAGAAAQIFRRKTWDGETVGGGDF